MHLLELAQQRNWQLVNLAKFSSQTPQDFKPLGALVNALPSEKPVQALLQLSIPIVRIGRLPHFDDPLVPAVISDRMAVGRLAAEHFAERGFRHLAYQGRDPWRDSKSLYDAYESRGKELGCVCHLHQLAANKIKSNITASQDWWSVLRLEFMKWIESLPRPVGLLGYGDTAADRYCQWVTEMGLRVPEDVAVLGVDNNVFQCESALVPISSVAPNTPLIAQTAVEVLEQLMAGKSLATTTIQVPPLGVVTRKSTDVLAASDPNVIKALRYIWDNVTENLAVDQIAQYVGVSRRTLERAFQRELGRGVNQEFQRRRLEKARDLLIHTDMRISAISDALQFGSSNYFCRVFRAAFGVNASHYRKESQQENPSP